MTSMKKIIVPLNEICGDVCFWVSWWFMNSTLSSQKVALYKIVETKGFHKNIMVKEQILIIFDIA